jgi:hypothetical protein
MRTAIKITKIKLCYNAKYDTNVLKETCVYAITIHKHMYVYLTNLTMNNVLSTEL